MGVLQCGKVREVLKLNETLAILFICLALAACGQPRPMAVGSSTSFYGLLAEGTKFGVSVGDPRASAREHLTAQGYGFAGTADCGESSLQYEIACQRGDTFDFYHQHRGLGHRTIFLEVTDERVEKIGWSFALLQIDS